MKASMQRGYMQKNEILQHLKLLDNNYAKVGYLGQLLTKEKLLSPQTRYNCYELMAEMLASAEYSFSFEGDAYIRAAEAYKKIGQLDSAIKIVIEKIQPEGRIMFFEKAGLLKEAAQESRALAIDLENSYFHGNGKNNSAVRNRSYAMAENAIRLYENIGDFYSAASFCDRFFEYDKEKTLKRAQLWETAGNNFSANIAKQIECYQNAAKYYCAKEKGVTALRLMRRTASLEKKLASNKKGAIALP